MSKHNKIKLPMISGGEGGSKANFTVKRKWNYEADEDDDEDDPNNNHFVDESDSSAVVPSSQMSAMDATTTKNRGLANNSNNKKKNKPMKEEKGGANVKKETEERKSNDEEEEERAGSSHSNDPAIPSHAGIMPKEMYQFCKTMLEMDEDKRFNLSSKKANMKFGAQLYNSHIFDESMDLRSYQNCFTHCYRFATSPSHVPMVSALKTVMDYVQSEDILRRRPDWPKEPVNSFVRFVQNAGGSLFDKNGRQHLMKDFKNKKDPRVIKAQEEVQKEKVHYIEQLREFLDTHRDGLFQQQIVYLEKEIKKRQKALETENNGKRRDKEAKSAKQQKLPPTPFELYKRAKAHKYMHLPEQDREDKLRRHFNKLTQEQREIYEQIAATL